MPRQGPRAFMPNKSMNIKVKLPLALPQVPQTLDHTCGAACFASMYKYFKNTSLDDMHFAHELKTLELGYTLPESIVELAQHYGFSCEIKREAQVEDLLHFLSKGAVIFVTWWYEDSGHYSLVKLIDHKAITLMDPWTAREGQDQHRLLSDFIPHWKARGSVLIAVSTIPS